jgi:hypothetical protein
MTDIFHEAAGFGVGKLPTVLTGRNKDLPFALI